MNPNHDEERADDRLDDLLGQWAEQTSVPERVADLQQRIVESAAESAGHTPKRNGRHSDLVAPYRRVIERRTVWASGFAVGAVAMLLLSVGVWFVAMSGSTADSDLPPEYAWLGDEQVRDKQQLLSEMDAMFDGQLAWLAESGDRMEFGLTELAGDNVPAGDSNDHLAVRVVVQRRESSGDDWQVAWALDVVSRNEEFVRVAPRDPSGGELKLWTYRLPNGLIAVDSELEMSGHDGLHATTSGLQEDRQPVQVFTSDDNGTEYRVFQTVAVLDGGLS